jgi:hypothetical protein
MKRKSKSGYTLPSGGDQVLLASGSPLYGPCKPPLFKPLMRATAANVDRAGNVWVTNNWEPNTIKLANPGGDGMVFYRPGRANPVWSRGLPW